MNHLLQKLHQNRLIVVLVCLTLLILGHPVIENWPSARFIFHVFFGVFLLAALFAVSRTRRTFVLALLLGLPALLLFWLSLIPWTELVSNWVFEFFESGRFFLMLGFLCLVAGNLLTFVMRAGRISGDKLCGAVSVYLIFGLIGAMTFAAIDVLDDTAFRFNKELMPPSELEAIDPYQRSMRLFYFSFVTLSTLGYGDITPVSGFARTFAFLLAISGQLYLTILVARLVGLHTTSGGDLTMDNAED